MFYRINEQTINYFMENKDKYLFIEDTRDFFPYRYYCYIIDIKFTLLNMDKFYKECSFGYPANFPQEFAEVVGHHLKVIKYHLIKERLYENI